LRAIQLLRQVEQFRIRGARPASGIGEEGRGTRAPRRQTVGFEQKGPFARNGLRAAMLLAPRRNHELGPRPDLLGGTAVAVAKDNHTLLPANSPSGKQRSRVCSNQIGSILTLGDRNCTRSMVRLAFHLQVVDLLLVEQDVIAHRPDRSPSTMSSVVHRTGGPAPPSDSGCACRDGPVQT